MSKAKVAQSKRAPKKRKEQPVSAGIRRAAKRAGIEPTDDSTRVTFMRDDLALAVSEIRGAFDDVFEAELSDDGAQHDVLVLRALRRLRTVQAIVECVTGGAL